MARKRKPSVAELANDASLRWNDYKWGEVLVSDTHSEDLRFIGRDGDMVRLATLGGMSALPEPVHMLTVRRRVFVPGPAYLETKTAVVV